LNRFSVFIAAICAASLLPAAAQAVPSTEAVADQHGLVAEIPFDPPLGQELRYRYQEAIEDDGKTTLRWDTSSYRFERNGDGFLLTVSPIASGSNESDPLWQAVEKRLGELVSRPFVLELSASGEILALRDEALYWEKIFEALEGAIAESAPEEFKDPGAKVAFANYLDMMREIPAENRLGLLVQEIAPLLEFGDTGSVVGEPVEADLEGHSPFGGKLTRRVRISLERVKDGIAHLSIRTTIPRDELQTAAANLLSRMAEGTDAAEELVKSEEVLRAMEQLRYASLAEYEVDVEDGMLVRYRSTETIELAVGEEKDRKVTTQTIARID
jgi:hypothetical protein